MINIKNYILDTKTYKYLLYYALAQIILSISAQIMTRYTGRTSLLNITSASLDVITFLSFPAGAIIAADVSSKLNRSSISWFIFTLFTSPIALIILSRKKYYVDAQFSTIYQKYKSTYLKSKGENRMQLKKGKISQVEFDEHNKILMLELESSMNQDIRAKAIQTTALHNKPINEITKSIYPLRADTIVAYKKCPACGTTITGNETDCRDCGLRLR